MLRGYVATQVVLLIGEGRDVTLLVEVTEGGVVAEFVRTALCCDVVFVVHQVTCSVLKPIRETLLWITTIWSVNAVSQSCRRMYR